MNGESTEDKDDVQTEVDQEMTDWDEDWNESKDAMMHIEMRE